MIGSLAVDILMYFSQMDVFTLNQGYTSGCISLRDIHPDVYPGDIHPDVYPGDIHPHVYPLEKIHHDVYP